MKPGKQCENVYLKIYLHLVNQYENIVCSYTPIPNKENSHRNSKTCAFK